MLSPLRELWAFLKVRRKWWLLPIALALLLLGLVLFAAPNAVLSPFLYTTF